MRLSSVSAEATESTFVHADDDVEALQAAMPRAEVTRVGPPVDDPLNDVRVSAASGEPLPTDGGRWIEICRTHFKAIHERDAYTAKSLWSRNVEVSFRDISPDYS